MLTLCNSPLTIQTPPAVLRHMQVSTWTDGVLLQTCVCIRLQLFRKCGRSMTLDSWVCGGPSECLLRHRLLGHWIQVRNLQTAARVHPPTPDIDVDSLGCRPAWELASSPRDCAVQPEHRALLS